MTRRICVFCGSSVGRDAAYARTAEIAARALVRRGFGIVYGGGRIGLMGVLADTALAAGGEVIGVIPSALAREEVAHEGLTALHVVESMHERKALMADLSDGFLALPGGYGTMDEFCEILTWRQLHIHDKPIALLDVRGLFAELLALFDRMTADGFVREDDRRLFESGDDIERLLDHLSE